MPAPATTTILWLIAVLSAGLGLLGLQAPIRNEDNEDNIFDVPWWKGKAAQQARNSAIWQRLETRNGVVVAFARCC